jgi:hypothetical protein
VSNEFSVSRYQGRYNTLVTGATRPRSSARRSFMYRSDSLEGPFTGQDGALQHPRDERQTSSRTTRRRTPSSATGTRLLITYNVNSFDTNDLYVDTSTTTAALRRIEREAQERHVRVS